MLKTYSNGSRVVLPALWLGGMALLYSLSISVTLPNHGHMYAKGGQLVLSYECVMLPCDDAVSWRQVPWRKPFCFGRKLWFVAVF